MEDYLKVPPESRNNIKFLLQHMSKKREVVASSAMQTALKDEISNKHFSMVKDMITAVKEETQQPLLNQIAHLQQQLNQLIAKAGGNAVLLGAAVAKDTNGNEEQEVQEPPKKKQKTYGENDLVERKKVSGIKSIEGKVKKLKEIQEKSWEPGSITNGCLLYTSPSPRDQRGSRMPSSA